MKDSFLALLKSRKTIAVLLAVTATTILCALGKISVDDFVKFTGALTGVLVMGIAAEDAAAKRHDGNRGDDA